MKMKNVLSAALTRRPDALPVCRVLRRQRSSPSPSASASPEASQQPEATTIQVAALESGYGADMWREVADAFTAQTGIQVQLTVDKKLEDVIGPAMQGGEFPDVIHLATGREAGLTISSSRTTTSWISPTCSP